MNADSSEFTAIVDRFEGDEKVFAIIELPDLDHFIIPAEYLPAGTSEGESLRISIYRNPSTTAKAVAEVRKLQAALLKGG